MANPFDDPEFGKPARPANPFNDPNYRGPSVGPGPSALSRAGTYIDDLGRQFAQGGTMGFSDEAASVAAALADQQQPSSAGSSLPDHGRTWGQSYDKALKGNRLRDSEFEKNNPVASTAAQVAGGIATLPVTMAPRVAGAAAKGATMLGNMLRGAGVGAGYGGVSGFGRGEGGFENRAISAGVGAGGGAVIGGAVPPVAAGAGWVARALRESPAGQWVGANVTAPIYDKTAALAEALVRKERPKNLSAAAPEGGQALPVDGTMMRLSDMLRNRATANRDIAGRGAQERLAKEFERYGLDPQNAGRELDRLGGGAVLANAGPLGTLDRTARTMYDQPGQAGSIINAALDDQRRGAPRRMVSAFEGEQPPPQVYDAQRYLAANKSQVGSDVYDPLRASKLNVSGDMQKLLEIPAIREAYDQMTADAAKFGRTLTPFDFMHGVKRQLNQNADAAFASGKPVNKDMVGSVADEWERAIYAANPQIQAADQSFARAAQLPDLFEQGRQFLRTGTTEMADANAPSALAAQLPQLDNAGRSVFAAGATNTVRDKALQGPGPTRRLAGSIEDGEILQEKLVQMYGPERAAEILRNSQAERHFLRGEGTMRGGSGSSGNIAHLVDDGLQMPNPASIASAPNLVARVWDAGADMLRRQNAGNEPVRTEMARLLMERNPTANLQTLDSVEALMRQRLAAALRNSRIGTGVSATGGGDIGSSIAP